MELLIKSDGTVGGTEITVNGETVDLKILQYFSFQLHEDYCYHDHNENDLFADFYYSVLGEEDENGVTTKTTYQMDPKKLELAAKTEPLVKKDLASDYSKI